MHDAKVVTREDLDTGIKSLELIYTGKNGITFRATGLEGEKWRILVRTDDFSAFDVESEQPIPAMGLVLNQMAVWAFDILKDIVDTHLISSDIDEIGNMIRENLSADEKVMLSGRCMLVEEVAIIPVEWVVRKHIVGSAAREAEKFGGHVSDIFVGVDLPTAHELSESIVTPATKALRGKKDMNIGLATADHIIDVFVQGFGISSPLVSEEGISELTRDVRDSTLACFEEARRIADRVGWLIFDGKLEFGLKFDGSSVGIWDGKPKFILADEAITPAAARFVRKVDYVPGQNPDYYDKEKARGWLQAEAEAGRWDKKSPMPRMSDELIGEITDRYVEVYQSLTGREVFIPA